VIREVGNHTTYPKGMGSQKWEWHHAILLNLESIRPKVTAYTKLDSLMDQGVGSKAHKRGKSMTTDKSLKKKECTGFYSLSLIKLYRNPLKMFPLSSLGQSLILTDLNEPWVLFLSQTLQN